MNLALTLDAEFRRVAKQEQIPMEELVSEVSRLTDCSTRQLYNYRSSKWDLPARLIPILCKRFQSQALLYALIQECDEQPVEELPEQFDLVRMVTQAVRADMSHYEHFLNAFDSNGIDANELTALRESGERIIVNLRHLEAIATADYERRKSLVK